ncbi:histone deacetylase family protein [Methylobacterium terricola]|uniref:Histone deacetylase family protein n=1 Tax=Methylobacterium terricola TaxID=2583531 RepID=A0A5C4LAM2_9HYPH|nr:histone deacetylase family protein [Methylobacterium terricola]TNC08042.1 histone deacetylase family protein [Methylobacterium terricola]
MTTLHLTHTAALTDLAPPWHPERANRIRAIEGRLERQRFAALVREQAPRVALSAFHRAHDEAYVSATLDGLERGCIFQPDGDTQVGPGTLEAVLRSAGAAVQAVDEVMTGQVRNAVSVMRPPGHHAGRARSAGFCFFNNVAVAARHAQAVHGAARVSILDWDAHHGDGTQEIFWDDTTVLFCSTHQWPLYPGTGAKSECGEHGTVVNVPFAEGADGTVFREALATLVLPRIAAFEPDLVLISAGFDAHWRDPLTGLAFAEEDFRWATERVVDIADRVCGGRIVSVLEGGYDLIGLARSDAAHVEALMEPPARPFGRAAEQVVEVTDPAAA